MSKLVLPKRDLIRPTRRSLITGAAALLAMPYIAKGQTLLKSGKAGGGAAACSTPTSADTDVTAWISAVIAAGGCPTQATANALTTMVQGMKSDSVYLLDRFWILGLAGVTGGDTHQAQIDLINLQTWTSHGSFTLDIAGFTGNGSTGYLDSNFNPSTQGVNFTNTNAAFGISLTNNRTTANATVQIGMDDGTNNTQVLIFDSGTAPTGNTIAWINSTGANNFNSAVLSGTRHRYWFNKGTATECEMFFDGTKIVQTGSLGTGVSPNLNFLIGAQGTGSGAANFSADSIGYALMGSGFSPSADTLAPLLDARIATCMSALGI